MAQIANTDAEGSAAVTARRETFPHSTADVTPDLSHKTQNTTLYLVDKTAAPARNMVGTSGPNSTTPGLLLPTTQAALEMAKVGGAVVGFWFQRGVEQLAHNSQSLKKLAAVRDWQEGLEIQVSFLRDSLSRLNEGMSRYADEVGRIVARSRDARAGASAATVQ